MKRILTIAFLLINITAFSQFGMLMQSSYTLDNGDVLKLLASKILTSNLTYNSSGLTVSYASANRVKLSGTTDIVAGNSIRFGSPTTGTIYQIQSISTDTLTLDQTFTGSVSDEFYWGGVGTWLDESGAGNNAVQSTASKQPKLLWAGTTNARVYSDGVDDCLVISNSFNPGSDYAWFFAFTPYNSSINRRLLSNSVSTNGYEIYHSIARVQFRGYYPSAVDVNITGDDLPASTFKRLAINKNADTLTTYIGGTFNKKTTVASPISTTGNTAISGLTIASSYYLNSSIKEIRIYSRKLTTNELIMLTK